MMKWMILLGLLISVQSGFAQSGSAKSQSGRSQTGPAKSGKSAGLFHAADASALYRSQQILTDVIVHDIFNPPVASRIYAYSHMAAYEALAVAGSGKLKPFHTLLSGFPAIQYSREADPVIVALEAFRLTGRSLVFSEEWFSDSMQVLINEVVDHRLRLSRRKPAQKADRILQISLEAGKLVADSMAAWISKDNYKETRSARRYQLQKKPGTWLPTPPGYMQAIEPHWQKMRTITMDSASQHRPPAVTPFSTEKGSQFYNEAYEVYSTGVNMTEEQRAIAAFWDCNPFHITMQGHVNYATKKITPGGHWMQIAGLASRMRNFGMEEAARAYAFTAIAIYDGFISCWDEKYNSHLIRPETYINSYIDESWRPLLQTPPFPEYPSGHSVVSGAASVVLTRLFGENFAFVDDTEKPYGLPERSFPSFEAACLEAAISRLYGGIHYRPAIEFGVEQGRKVGKGVVDRLKMGF